MKRFILAIAVVGVLGVSDLLAADVTSKTQRSSTTKIEIYGDLGLKAAFREDFFDALFPRRNATVAGTWEDDRDEIIGVPVLSLGIEGKLQDNIGAVIKLGLVPGAYGNEAPTFGSKNSYAYFEELYVYAKEFLGQYTNVYIGEKNVKIDLRGNGDEFFCNVLESENPYTGAAHTDPALTGVPVSVSGMWTPPTTPALGIATPGGMFWNPYMGGNAWWNNYAGQAKRSAFAGAQVEWVFSREKTGLEPFRIDFAIGKVLETQMADTDTALFVGRPLLTFDATVEQSRKHYSKIQFVGSVMASDKDAYMGALGAGVSLYPSDMLEIFAEYMGQWGRYTRSARATGKNTTMQDSHAWYVGAKLAPDIEVQKELKITPFAEASFWWVGGDRGDPYGSNKDFVSFEDVDTFLIMEDNDFGLDVDSNYRAVKAEVGIKVDVIEFSVRYGVFYALYAPNQDVYGPPPGGGKHFNRELGNEVDVRFSWKVKECVKINLVAAFLFDGFFWDETVRSRGLRPTGAGTGTDAAIGLAELLLEF